MDDENPTTKADQNVVVVVLNQSNLPIKVLIMVCTGSVLLVGGIIFIILFCIYFRNRRHRRGGINNRRSSSSSSSPDGANSRGLEPSVLRTLSDFRYSSRSNFGGGGGMEPPAKECAVCLSGFEEGEMGRVLPNCKHSFHLQCIDIWFKFNSNCPLCRTQVAAVLPAVIIKNPDDHADVDVGLESRFTSVLNHVHAPPVSPREEEEEDTVITCSTSAYQDKKAPAELTSIICS